MACQDKTLNNETEEPPTVETTTIETTGAILGIVVYKTPYHDVWSGHGLLNGDRNVGHGSIA
jgi:hypothetical protein